ncbi:MAG: hypothetical protein ABIA93_05300 [Candidatus Woesearchaeota archaeon]
MDQLKHKERRFKHFISIPIIYSVFIAIVILDIWTEIYHRICFPLYGLPYVKRRNYILIDRHKLKYLSFGRKIACIYCGYANGVAHYLTEIAGQTEKYWCGIMHHKKKGFIAPEHHASFLRYNDKKQFEKFKGKRK